MLAKGLYLRCREAGFAALLKIAAISILMVGAPADAVADEGGANPFPADWQYELTLYGFASSIDGDAGIRNVDAEVDVGFDDILENLDFGAMGFIAGRNDTWSFVLDAFYLKLSTESSNARSIVNTTLTTSLEAEIEQSGVEGFVGRRILGNRDSDTPFRIDALGGLRYNNISGELSAQASLLGLTATAQRKRDVDWIDPVIGLRGEVWTSDRFRLLGWVDYGGFGIGADSTWQVAVGVNYLAWDRVSLYALYRALAFDYEEGSRRHRLDHSPIGDQNRRGLQVFCPGRETYPDGLGSFAVRRRADLHRRCLAPDFNRGHRVHRGPFDHSGRGGAGSGARAGAPDRGRDRSLHRLSCLGNRPQRPHLHHLAVAHRHILFLRSGARVWLCLGVVEYRTAAVGGAAGAAVLQFGR